VLVADLRRMLRGGGKVPALSSDRDTVGGFAKPL
jgi:hypothetical protein